MTQAAEKLGVERGTAYDYWNQWKQTEEAQYIDTEFYRLTNQLKTLNPEKVLDAITKIKVRMTTEKTEVKANVKMDADIKTPTNKLIQFSRQQQKVENK